MKNLKKEFNGDEKVYKIRDNLWEGIVLKGRLIKKYTKLMLINLSHMCLNLLWV